MTSDDSRDAGVNISNQPAINNQPDNEVDVETIWRMYEDLPPTRQMLETADYFDFSAAMNTSALDLLMKSFGVNDSDQLRSRYLGSAGADTFKIAVDTMTLYVTPLIIVIGVVGNALSLAVFSLTYLHRLSSSLYLSMLSVADVVFLLALLVVWLERVDEPSCPVDGRLVWSEWTGWSALT